MFEVFVKTHFSSAHFLRNYPGKCEHLHGHNWEVEVAVKSDRLNQIDVAIDFRDLKSIVKKIMDELDHRNLNELKEFSQVNPSSERLAEFIFNRVGQELKAYPGVSISRVTVCETPSTGVVYSG